MAMLTNLIQTIKISLRLQERDGIYQPNSHLFAIKGMNSNLCRIICIMLSLNALKIEEERYGHGHGVSKREVAMLTCPYRKPGGRVVDASLPNRAEIGDEVVVGVADDAAADEVADFGG